MCDYIKRLGINKNVSLLVSHLERLKFILRYLLYIHLEKPENPLSKGLLGSKILISG